MKDYIDYPPEKYLDRVLKNCPRSALIYTKLWDKRGKYMRIHTTKKDIRKDYLMSPTLFRNLLTPLAFMNLVKFVESDDKFQIDVLGPNLNE